MRGVPVNGPPSHQLNPRLPASNRRGQAPPLCKQQKLPMAPPCPLYVQASWRFSGSPFYLAGPSYSKAGGEEASIPHRGREEKQEDSAGYVPSTVCPVLATLAVHWMCPPTLGRVFLSQSPDLNVSQSPLATFRNTQEHCFTSHLGIP